MQSPYWGSTVIFIGWDDWGGFYDHVMPPRADSIGYGIRVPGLIISPWVRQGIDHQYVSFDAYNRFIEDVFLGRARLDPNTDGRPDARPVVREALQTLTDPVTGASIPVGDLLNDFTFTRAPLPPLVLPVK
jgi:phospholipase C